MLLQLSDKIVTYFLNCFFNDCNEIVIRDYFNCKVKIKKLRENDKGSN